MRIRDRGRPRGCPVPWSTTARATAGAGPARATVTDPPAAAVTALLDQVRHDPLQQSGVGPHVAADRRPPRRRRRCPAPQCQQRLATTASNADRRADVPTARRPAGGSSRAGSPPVRPAGRSDSSTVARSSARSSSVKATSGARRLRCGCLDAGQRRAQVVADGGQDRRPAPVDLGQLGGLERLARSGLERTGRRRRGQLAEQAAVLGEHLGTGGDQTQARLPAGAAERVGRVDRLLRPPRRLRGRRPGLQQCDAASSRTCRGRVRAAGQSLACQRRLR